MRPNPTLAAGLLALAFTTLASAQDDIAEILSNPAIDYSRPADRARAMMRIETIENARLQNARTKAMAMGLPLRMEKPGGGVKELIDLLLGVCFLREAPERAIGADLRAGKWGLRGRRGVWVELKC